MHHEISVDQMDICKPLRLQVFLSPSRLIFTGVAVAETTLTSLILKIDLCLNLILNSVWAPSIGRMLSPAFFNPSLQLSFQNLR